MSSFIIAALSVVFSLVAIVAAMFIFKYVRQFANQLQQFGSTLNDIQSRMGSANGAPSSTSSIPPAAAQPTVHRTPTVSGSPRIYIQKQGLKTRPIDPRAPTPGMGGMEQPPTVVTKSEPEPEKFINFDCPFCGQNLDAPPTMSGTQIKCPSCEKPITIPSTSSKKPAPAPTPAPSRPPAARTPDNNEFKAAQPDTMKKDVTIRIDLGSTPNLQEPDQASIMVKRQDIKVRRMQ